MMPLASIDIDSMASDELQAVCLLHDLAPFGASLEWNSNEK